ncbi:hypothetical protein VDR55_21575, partial [Xanthomonas campestris pv. campestris]|nr:hypothetical protein [Xanthomonas campestris pv. campestris]
QKDLAARLLALAQALSVTERQLHGSLLNMRRVVSRICGALFRVSLEPCRQQLPARGIDTDAGGGLAYCLSRSGEVAIREVALNQMRIFLLKFVAHMPLTVVKAMTTSFKEC